jgi:hypothetical protein
LFFLTTVYADSFGIGIGAGQPTGLNFRYEMTYEMSLQGGAGYSFIGVNNVFYKGIYANLDLVYFFRRLLPIGSGNYLPLYIGAGFNEIMNFIEIDEKTTFISYTALELPIGAYYPIPINNDNHIEIYGQVRPSLLLIGSSGFMLSFDFGIRYHF